MELNENIKIIGNSGDIVLLVNGGKPKTSEQPCVTLRWDNEDDFSLANPEILGKYENLDTPMTYMAFELHSPDKGEMLTAILKRYISEEQVKEINEHLSD